MFSDSIMPTQTFFNISMLMRKIVSDTYFFTQIPQEQIYRASFKVIEGDIYSMEMADPSTERFKIRARDYRERLNLLFRRSYIRHGFSGTEILALDG